MKSYFVITVLTLSLPTIFAQQPEMPKMGTGEKPAVLMSGLGAVHHSVSTKNAEAQRFFDQGLALIYGFNHDEAVRSFKRAAELDPQLAMAWWGIALALGPNINLDVDPEHEKAAYDAVQKALALTKNASENERAYIQALAKRYSIDANANLKKLALDYKHAMGELIKRYPNDLDAATLYAESAMDLRPWRLWTADGKPAEGTEEIVAVLESVLRRNPNHPGAIHYYIHTVEASPNPDRALVYASKLAKLMPAAGHLVHMPSHIYERVGDYEASARSNVAAAAIDEEYFKATGAQGVYTMYYAHNLHFLAVASSMEGRCSKAIEAAVRLEAAAKPVVKDMPMAEVFLPTPILMMVRFRKWDDILKLRQPEASLMMTTAVWHFARGMAYVARGDLANAEIEQQAFVSAEKSIPPDEVFTINTASQVVAVGEKLLLARIAEARRDSNTALEMLHKGVELEDSLAYEEPPSWFLPMRESLGGFLLRHGNYVEAERVFRADLERNRRNGRSLFGLMESLKRQKKAEAAAVAQHEFEKAWKNADTKLTAEDL